MKSAKKIAVSLLGILCTATFAAGISGCKTKGKPVEVPTHITTVRYALPNDGSTPAAHTGLENIGYMATVLDNQTAYHAYAHNSTKSTGYEQITQTWKDYKGKSLSGYDKGVMVCSDLSYSSLIKSGTQTCFVNDEAYMRNSSKPGKNTTPETAEWSTSTPTKYSKEDYIDSYGEFSTELSVYVINVDTIESSDPVTVNDEGNYVQKFYLKENAACYYQNKMKTNGNLKGYPSFDRIEITFTFDNKWQVLSSYCEEKTKIAPKAMGGVQMKSTSKTTTTYYYGEEDFGTAHYGYFDGYFVNYVGKDITPDEPSNEAKKPELLDVLGGGFAQVINGGQQFDVDLTLGGTQYKGKLFASLGDLNDVLNTLEVRLALGTAESGSQDLYAEFKKGDVNLYYSNNFAMTANIDAVKTVVGQFSDWVKRFEDPNEAPAPDTGDSGEEGGSSSLDLNALLASLNFTYDDTSAKIALDTDNLLGTGIGAKVDLNFNRSIEEDGDVYSFKSANLGSITYSADSINLSIALAPDSSEIISHDPSSTAANLADYASGVYNMLNSNTLKVGINFDGTKQGVIPELDGVKLTANAYVALGNEIATKADITAEYAGASAKLTAYYDINIHGGNYGKVYLNLTEFNGVKFDAKIYSNINDTLTAVDGLLSAINASNASPAAYAAVQSEENVNKLVAIINGVLNLDFGKVIGSDLYASNSEIRVSADVDAIVGALGLDLNGLKFGTAALKLNLNGDKASLNLSLAALGLNVSVAGAADTLTEPNKNEYIDATALVNLVTEAAEAAKDIISAEDIAFDIDATVTADNVPMSVEGNGEVIWKDGKIRAAFDLTLAVADGTTSSQKDTVALKLVYDETVTADNQPFVKFAVNSLAMEICNKDLAQVKDGIKLIKNNIDLLINGEKTGNASPEEAVASYGVAAYSDGVAADIESILTNESVQKILSAVLGFAADLDVTLGNVGVDGGKVNALIINHAAAGNLKLATGGNLSLDYNSDGAEIYALVKAGNGSAMTAISNAIAECDVYKTSEAEKAFATVVYNYLFAVVEDLTVENVLGSNTYAVKATLDGSASAIDALDGINVTANLYYTQGLDGDKVTKDKLVELDVELDIKGTYVKANARYSGQHLYISLDKIGTTVYKGIKFKADRNDIYGAAEQLVKIITDDNIISSFTNLLHPNNAAATASYAVAMQEDTQSAVTDVISKLLSLDFKKALEFKKVDGVNTAIVQIDYIVETFGLSVPKLGTVTAGVNPKTHEIDAKLSLEGSVWASLNAKVTARRDYEDDWQSGYIDIGFINTLVKDFYNTLTDKETGEVHSLYTFSGDASVNVTIKIVININKKIELNITTLTLGFDENGQFYFTLLAHLNESNVNLGLTKIYLCHDWNIAVTYSNGCVTFGRKVGTENAEFKVMTLDYLLDNIFVKHEGNTDSPLRWLLDMDDTPWNLIADNVNINSGLTRPQTYEMYGALAQAGKDDGLFYLSNYINGFAVNVNDDTVSEYNTATAAAEALKLAGNYYAFDINAGKLTNGLLKYLYVGLLRSDAQGICGLIAKTSLSPVSAIKLDINVNLNNYYEGATIPDGEFNYADWANGDSVAAPNYYNIINDGIEGGINFGYEFTSTDPNTNPVFGCYNTENGGSYEASYVLARRMLTVVDGEGNVLHEVDLAHGSTVKLLNEFSPSWADENHTQIIYYVDENDTDLGAEMILNADTTIKTAQRAATEVIFNIGIDDLKVSGAISGDLHEYPLNGYTWLGWYNDAALENEVTNVNDITNFENGVKTVYGLFIKTETTINGVVYTLNSATREYAVTGYDTEGIKPYTVSGSLLTLENEIKVGDRIYSVTSIGSEAFNAMGKSTNDGGIGAGLKNVIVPENIVLVGTKAFGDNYAIESVKFLADSVGFDGKYGDKNYPFYGCSEKEKEGEDRNTILKLYYNEIYSTAGEGVNGEGNPYWSHFRTFTELFTTKYRYIGNDGGSRHAAGTWSIVEYVQTGDDMNALGCLENGLKGDETKTAEQIKAEVVAELNKKTAKNGYIEAYNVTVTGGYDNDGYAPNGKLNKITVEITAKNNENDRYYQLDVSSTTEVGADAEGDVKELEVDGTVKTFAKVGATVTIKPAREGYEISAATVVAGSASLTNNTTSCTLVMTKGIVEVSVACEKTAIHQITLNSAIAYSYGGTNYGANEQAVLSNVTEGTTVIEAPVATDDNYLFLGWAYKDGGSSLKFAASTDETLVLNSSAYYAVWVLKHDNVTFTATKDGTIPNYSIADNGGAFYKWYTDSTYATEVTAISTENTVLCIRLEYTVTVNVSASDTIWAYTKSENTSDLPSEAASKKSYGAVSLGSGTQINGNFTFNMLDGQTVTVSRYWSDGVTIRVFNSDNSNAENYLVFAFNSKYNQGGKRKMLHDSSHYVTLEGNWSIASGIDNSGDNYYKADDGSSDKLFGTLNPDSNVSITLKT